jgi:hypothetical protein
MAGGNRFGFQESRFEQQSDLSVAHWYAKLLRVNVYARWLVAIL